ncbi:MAG: hypothetical protein FJW69_03245 [Actinobacteria bacterium]|nr:hypothetical protein [Actinomycetota bacterium]
MSSLIIKKIKKNFTNQRGQVAIFVGLLLVAIVGILAYVIDEGSLYESRSSFQTIADSSALAGAQELPDASDAVQAAIDYAEMNEVPSDLLTIVIEDTLVPNDTIRVTAADMNQETFFAGVFGIDSTPVGASAAAIAGSPAEFFRVVPFGILESDWVPGEEYELKWGPPGNRGNFGALALGGNGANNYRKNIREGFDGALHVGDVVETEPGNMRGPTLQGTEDRIYNYPDYILNSFEELTNVVNGEYVLTDSADSQFVMCPLIDWVPNGRGEVTILAFVPFIITNVTGHQVYGTFINEALIITEGSIAPLDEHGIRIIRLID